jgi:hypothetical protein
MRLSGKPYGYNFQRIGVLRVSGGAQGPKALCGTLHANPNPCKDWAENVTAYDVDRSIEKYHKLSQDEDERLATWKRDIELSNKLSDEEYVNEMILEGISRRLGLFEIMPDGTGKYVYPEVGMAFTCKAKITEKGYFDICTIEKPAGAKYYSLVTTNVRKPETEDDVAFAMNIALAIEQKLGNKQLGMFVESDADVEEPLPF